MFHDPINNSSGLEANRLPLDWLQGRYSRILLAVYWPMLFTVTHIPFSFGETVQIGKIGSDKLLHFACFSFLTILMGYARLLGKRRSDIANYVAAVIIASVYAYVDDLTQPWFGRHFDLYDVLASQLGIFAIFILLLRSTEKRWNHLYTVITARVVIVCVMPMVLIGLFYGKYSIGMVILLSRILGIAMPADKEAHFLGTMVITLVVVAARPFGKKHPVFRGVLVLMVMFISGPVIEMVQGQFGRAVEIEDVIAHEWGVFAATVLICIRYFWKRWMSILSIAHIPAKTMT